MDEQHYSKNGKSGKDELDSSMGEPDSKKLITNSDNADVIEELTDFQKW